MTRPKNAKFKPGSVVIFFSSLGGIYIPIFLFYLFNSLDFDNLLHFWPKKTKMDKGGQQIEKLARKLISTYQISGSFIQRF